MALRRAYRRLFCTISSTSRESEMFWSSRKKNKTDSQVPRKITEIPNHAESFKKKTTDGHYKLSFSSLCECVARFCLISHPRSDLAHEFAAAESRLHRKVKTKDDREVWNALSRAQKYRLKKGLPKEDNDVHGRLRILLAALAIISSSSEVSESSI
eukprot:1394435-Amorphochlora_amoeboformis.AAC.1